MKKKWYNKKNISLNTNLFWLNQNIFWYHEKKSDIIKIYFIEYKFILIELKYIMISCRFLLLQHFSNHTWDTFYNSATLFDSNSLQPAFDFTTIFQTGSFHYKLQKTFQKKKETKRKKCNLPKKFFCLY